MLIVKIELDNITSMFSNCKIKSVPTAKVKIHNRLYRVQSAIFFNNTTTSREYSIMVRDNMNGWFLINNENVEKRPWPNNSKNAHILVLEEK